MQARDIPVGGYFYLYSVNRCKCKYKRVAPLCGWGDMLPSLRMSREGISSEHIFATNDDQLICIHPDESIEPTMWE